MYRARLGPAGFTRFQALEGRGATGDGKVAETAGRNAPGWRKGHRRRTFWSMQSLRVVFIVQGEGRGHMTQALALSRHLREAGHQIVLAMVGRSPWRSLPAYFRSGIGAPVREFDAPVQAPGPDGRACSPSRSALDVVRRAPGFLHAMGSIGQAAEAADVVVNFFDLLGGLTTARQRTRAPTVAVAHNYAFLLPELDAAPGPQHVRRAVLAYARATAAGASARVALSFDELPDRPEVGLHVAPPLLRTGLDDLRRRDDGYLLAYVLNTGYAAELAAWQARNPDVEVHCYLDGGPASLATHVQIERGFFAHDLDDHAFLDHLGRCRAFVGSAGFESLCEAHYLGKPVMAVPTEGQFEQTLNAWDAERCGVARPGAYADLDDFWAGASPPAAEAVRRFRSWVARAPDALVDIVQRAAHGARS
jgi:hypothetical protein